MAIVTIPVMDQKREMLPRSAWIPEKKMLCTMLAVLSDNATYIHIKLRLMAWQNVW